jgi:hypothetical protein
MSIENYKTWMAATTTDEKNTVVAVAGTSLQVLYQVASGYRKPSSDLAARIEKGIAALARRKREVPLPIVTRGDISEACAECPYMKRCGK